MKSLKNKIRMPMLVFYILAVCCSCGKIVAEQDSAEHSHVWVEADCVAPKHCEICGQTIGEAIGHSWVEATCSAPKTCTRCGKTEGSVLEHAWKAATCEEPETCTVCKATRGEALGHIPSGNSCNSEYVCERCGKQVPAEGHLWVEATCTVAKTCARCGESEGKPLGHSWKEATCTLSKTCDRCGATEGSAKGHVWKSATCLVAKKCEKCGAEEGKPLGHAFVNGKCSRCGEPNPNYVPPETFEDNQYYEVVDYGGYVDILGWTHAIVKVVARKDVRISATIFAYDSKGNVIGKSSDDVTLTKGKANYFSFTFEADVSNAKIECSFSAEKDSWSMGARDAVEMEKYNKSENYLYITFKQTKDDLGSFAKMKLLFYKNNKIIGAKESYFSTRTDHLTGKGSTDVAEISVYGEDFDRIEFIFEP